MSDATANIHVLESVLAFSLVLISCVILKNSPLCRRRMRLFSHGC
jgi:hypothetical protein